MIDLYRAIWRVSGRQQIVLIILAVLVAALAAVPLKFQQLVVNSLVEHGDVVRLAWNCAGFIAAVLLSAGLKFVLGLRLSELGEDVVRRIRARLYRNHVERARTEGNGDTGALVTMLGAEAEAVGSFVGSAIAGPVVQLGTLLSVIGFVVASQPWLGVVMAGVVLPQAVIVLGLQRRINVNVRSRVQSLRDASSRISGGDPNRLDEAVLDDFRDVYETRRRIFKLKLSSKFALGTISALGKVAILFLGGWLVLQGRTDVGTVVASFTALGRIDGPWRDLVSFFRTASTVRVKYGMLLPAIGPW